MAWNSAKDTKDNHQAEVAEFILNQQSFGINGSKIKEIVLFEESKVTSPPYRHPSASGIYLFRGNTVPLIDLRAYLELPKGEGLERQVVVVTEFNEMTTAFLADKVNRIHRLTWDNVKPLDSYLRAKAPQIIGTFNIDDREILILDLEQIIGEIFPQTVVNYDEKTFAEKPRLQKREEASIFFAEDSYIIRTQLQKVFKTVGYSKVRPFDNGRAALEALQEVSKKADREGVPLSSYVNLLITDIEMPQMDGLELCQKVKKDLRLELPVLMFSSLINEQVATKCDAAGADAYVSKPQTERLLDLIDELCLK